jgi:hypothetical protein
MGVQGEFHDWANIFHSFNSFGELVDVLKLKPLGLEFRGISKSVPAIEGPEK